MTTQATETTPRLIGISSLTDLTAALQREYKYTLTAAIKQTPRLLQIYDSMHNTVPVDFIVVLDGVEQIFPCFVKGVDTAEHDTLPYQIGMTRGSYLVRGHTPDGKWFCAACTPGEGDGLMLID